MASLTVSFAQTGFATLNRTINFSDATADLIVQAYQSEANQSLVAVATRAQVLNYWFNKTLVDPTKLKIQKFQTQPAVVPDPVSIV